MKLYTEEQMRDAIKMARNGARSEDNIIGGLNFIITPIELPSDEEINEESPYVPNDASLDFWAHKEGFVDGAKWMRDKIQGGNK